MAEPPVDLGFTHVALVCCDLDRTAAFYARYAGLRLVHQRRDTEGVRVGWLADGTRPFCIVFLESRKVGAPLGPFAHLGVAVESRARVDDLLAEARADGVTVTGPFDYGPPVGYGAFLQDPDGHTLEISYGQTVAYTLAAST
ncbi:MAG: VOC family protein [Rhodospirillales bacterium]